jgi:carbon-monoxide dehydrogenase medium subunit
MKPAPFDYSRPGTIEDTLLLLAELGSDAKVLAGGQSLLPILSMRLAAPAHLVDINRVPGLDTISCAPEGVRIGALVRHAALERDPTVRAVLPLLPEALRLVAHPAIRNRGTSVGSIVHADPAGELPAVLCLLQGSLTVSSAGGSRTIAARDLFIGALETALTPEELAVEAFFPACPPDSGTAFVEVSRRQGDYAVCGVAVLARVDPDRTITAVTAALMSVGPVPMVVDLAPAIAGLQVNADLSAAGRLASSLVETEADLHASAQYRRHLVGVLTDRAVRLATTRAVGES